MSNFGKKPSDFDELQPQSACLLICQSGCRNAAKSLCQCSSLGAKASSYNSNWSTYHMMFVAPSGG